MADIFVSYADEDKAWAEAFARLFTNCGWTVWWDKDIPYGREFSDVIAEELKAAKCVVVIWSARSVASHWVRNEAASDDPALMWQGGDPQLDRGIELLLSEIRERPAVPTPSGH